MSWSLFFFLKKKKKKHHNSCCYNNVNAKMLMDFLPVSARRILKEQMEQALSDTQHRLSAKNNELHAAHETIDKLEDRIGDFKSLK